MRGQPPSWVARLWSIGIVSFGAVGILGFLLTISVLGGLRAFDVAQEPAWFPPVMIGLVLVTGTLSTAKRYKVAQRRDLQRHSEVAADLDAGVAALERHTVSAAHRAIMEESREHAYFLRVEDGRALFVGYWPPDEISPTTAVEIARMPKSGVVLEVTFSGSPLEVESTFVHRQGMNRPALEIGEFATVAWEQLRRTYG